MLLKYNQVQTLRTIIRCRINECNAHIKNLRQMEPNAMISQDGINMLIKGYRESIEDAEQLFGMFTGVTSIKLIKE